MDLTGLKELGWSEGEVRVYAAVLESGIGSLNKIQEKTGIERRNIYDILNKLIEKGFVSYTLEKGKKTYQCIHPGKIREEIRRRTTALRKLEEKIPEEKNIHRESIRRFLDEWEYPLFFFDFENSFEKRVRSVMRIQKVRSPIPIFLHFHDGFGGQLFQSVLDGEDRHAYERGDVP